MHSTGAANEALKERLLQYGIIYPVISGIQIDINAVKRRMPDGNIVEASLCDHNCTAELGGYDCPSARLLNPGVMARTMSPAKEILKWIMAGVEGQRIARTRYLQNFFDWHCDAFQIPSEAAGVIRESLASETVEVNLFGGNPEMHPEITWLIRELVQAGCRVNLTTTGRRLMRDKKFRGELLAAPPHILALSADDFEIDELNRLLAMTLDELQKEWRRIPVNHGQKQKACEAVWVAKLSQQTEGFPLILFNMVLHPVNIARASAIIAMMEEAFPKAIVNPYPNQEAFHYGSKFFDMEQLRFFESLVDHFIERTISGGQFVRRLQYWLMIKAAFETWRAEPARIAKAIAGYNIWRCYKQPGAGRYLQIGRSIREAKDEFPGGHLGCFWNPATVTNHEQQAQIPLQIAVYQLMQMQTLAKAADRPCPGCAMPRLLFDLLTVQSGMDDELIPAFIKLRKEYAGF